MKENKMTTLFRQGIKFEEYWGTEVRAHHMNTRSVYRLLEDDDDFTIPEGGNILGKRQRTN